jgi:hypothetical protein
MKFVKYMGLYILIRNIDSHIYMVEPKLYGLLSSFLCQINAWNILLCFRAYDKIAEGSLTFQQRKLILQWCYIRQNVLSTFKTVET